MAVPLMRSILTDENEAVTLEGGDEFSGGQRPEAMVINRHARP